MDIIIPGATGALKGRGTVGPAFRLAQTRKLNECLPAWRCDSLTKGRFFLCGACFGKLGDGPATNAEEMWMSGMPGGEVVPVNARCHSCGGRAWPKD